MGGSNFFFKLSQISPFIFCKIREGRFERETNILKNVKMGPILIFFGRGGGGSLTPFFKFRNVFVGFKLGYTPKLSLLAFIL